MIEFGFGRKTGPWTPPQTSIDIHQLQFKRTSTKGLWSYRKRFRFSTKHLKGVVSNGFPSNTSRNTSNTQTAPWVILNPTLFCHIASGPQCLASTQLFGFECHKTDWSQWFGSWWNETFKRDLKRSKKICRSMMFLRRWNNQDRWGIDNKCGFYLASNTWGHQLLFG